MSVPEDNELESYIGKVYNQDTVTQINRKFAP